MNRPAPLMADALQARHASILRAVPSPSQTASLHAPLLCAHLQPIAGLADGTVFAHESLIRGAPGNRLRTPDELFSLARQLGQAASLERTCLNVGVASWAAQGAPGRLFVNLSAGTAIEWFRTTDVDEAVGAARAAGIAVSSLVVEITEHEHVQDLPALMMVAESLRRLGVRFALDDFGDGRSSLRLWSELRPEFVKIDKYFVRGVDHEPVKVQTLRGLKHFAQLFGTELVAEGIETAAELRVLRDLGLEYGQGWFLGRPQPEVRAEIDPAALKVVNSQRIAVLPETSRAPGLGFTVSQLLEAVEPAHPNTTVDEVAARFASEDGLRAVPVVDATGNPVGLIARQGFVDQYAKPFFKELFGRKPSLLFANCSPLLLDHNEGLESATAVLTSADQRYLAEGFVITQGGRYIGVGSGQRMVRAVTEARIEAARHANPLTFLPGNIPISGHIARLLASGAAFVACYADLNDFKPFNDHYGYWRGDEMILLVAKTLVEFCDPQRDFVGHVGGDDFVVLFQSSDWLDRCERIVQTFAERARRLYDPAALAAQGIHAEDRHGVARFFPLTSLALGVVRVPPGTFTQPEQVASAAAAAKHKAKQSVTPVVVELAQAEAVSPEA